MVLLFFDYIAENPGVALLASLIISLIVWLYKDGRSSIDKEHNKKIAELEESLRNLYRLEGLMALAFHQFKPVANYQNEVYLELYESLGVCNAYFDDELRTLVVGFYTDNDYSKLHVIKSMIQGTIKKLRVEKTDLLEKSNIDDMSKYMYRLGAPLKGIGGLIFILGMSYLVGKISLMNVSMYIKAMIGIQYISLNFSIMIVYGIIKFGKKLEKRLKIYYLTITFTPILMLLLALVFVKEIVFLSPIIQAGLFSWVIKSTPRQVKITTSI